MVLDGFCTRECRRDIEHALFPFEDDMESLDTGYEKSQVTYVPNEDARVQLWDIVRELRNAERIPVTTVPMEASIKDYSVWLKPRAGIRAEGSVDADSPGAVRDV
mgnify:CR=1 FL=1|jgi:hypothetical protein